MRETAFRKATRRIESEGRDQCYRLYSATALALWQYYGKRQQAIQSLLDLSRKVWLDCAKDADHSMIMLCERETGIEIQNGSGVSWRDVAYLNGQDPGEMTYAQWLYMRQQQIKWVRPQVMACMMISLHRKYGFGFERCGRIYGQIEEIESEYDCKPDRLRKACFEVTGVDIAEIVSRREVLGDE